jgi:metal-dependent amidase/aminoacylase/carboxypeptidase family protein
LLPLGVDLGLTPNRLQVVIFRWPEALQRGHMTFIARPGAYLWIGNGPGADLHTNAYDFNDTLLPIGAAGWVRLAEAALAAR